MKIKLEYKVDNLNLNIVGGSILNFMNKTKKEKKINQKRQNWVHPSMCQPAFGCQPTLREAKSEFLKVFLFFVFSQSH